MPESLRVGITSIIFDTPNQDLTGIAAEFSELDILTDQMWFNRTVSQEDIPSILQQCLVSPEMYLLGGNDSGLMLHAMMGRSINKKTATRARTIVRSAISRPPVTDPLKLMDELVEIQQLFNEMYMQGTPPDGAIRMSILDNAVAKLKAKPELVVTLANPMFKCLTDHPDDADRFLETLKDCAEDINTNPEFRQRGANGVHQQHYKQFS